MNDKLDEVAGELSDREAIDWDRILDGVESDQERRWIDNLRVISEVSRLARQGLEGHEPTEVLSSISGEWGHLRLLERIGAGGFGEVYRAWDTVLHRQVALKLVRDDRAAHGGGAEKALAEGRLLAKVDHPGVTRVHGVQTHQGRVGIWMELVEGTDLGNLLAERGRLSPAEAVSIGEDLCDALGAIHAANVVHKDLKPSNVMRRADGSIVITDFGAGRLRRIQADRSGMRLVGTPLAMAPELFRGEPATPQSDIYALGVLLYQLLSGTTPVEGTAREIMAAHEAGRRKPLSRARPDLPRPLVAVVERAVAPDPADRYTSAAEMGAALRRSLTAPAGRRRRRRLVLVAAAVIALAVIGGRALRPGGLQAEATFSRIQADERTELSARDEISPADQLMITLQSNRDAYVYVINLDRTGRGTLMFPMRGGGLQNPLPAGRAHDLPGEVAGAPFAWTFDTTVGLERFLVVASRRRLAEFERELSQLATVDVGGGVHYARLEDQALHALLRGVSGAAPVAAATPGRSAPQRLLELARRQATDGKSDVWLYEMELFNSGR